MDSNNIDLENMTYRTTKIGGATCKINKEEAFLLRSFDDIIPTFNTETGDYSITTENDITGAKTEFCLNKELIRNMCINLPTENDESDASYFEKYKEYRKEYWNHMIERVYAKGYENPSPTQTLAIPELINNRDSLFQFKSGTGKTSAFLIGLLWGFEPKFKQAKGDNLQYVFMTSSQQIAQQTYDQVIDIVPPESRQYVMLCMGAKKQSSTTNGGFKTSVTGTSTLNGERKLSIREEAEKIKHAQIIVCTIGKFYDVLIERRYIPSFDYLKAFCVDEFDLIVTPSSYSVDKIGTIMSRLKPFTQRVFFSATVTPHTLSITQNYFRKYSPKIGEPMVALLEEDDFTLDGIRQYYVESTTYAEKKEILLDLLKELRISQGIIFVNEKKTAIDIEKFLQSQEMPTPSIAFHADLSGAEREEIYQKFEKYHYRLLIATDVLARGIDVRSINVVINFDMPRHEATYIHRAGRGGRYGRKGTVITLVMVNNKTNEMISVDAINKFSRQNKMLELPENISTLL